MVAFIFVVGRCCYHYHCGCYRDSLVSSGSGYGCVVLVFIVVVVVILWLLLALWFGIDAAGYKFVPEAYLLFFISSANGNYVY